jgi:hypothetical protein
MIDIQKGPTIVATRCRRRYPVSAAAATACHRRRVRSCPCPRIPALPIARIPGKRPAGHCGARDLGTEIAFLARALKAPALRDSADRLAARAREETWIHEEYQASQTHVLDERDTHYYYENILWL